jgi:hypothetical protein
MYKSLDHCDILNVMWMDRFTPELLGRIASSGLAALFFEIIFVKFCFYLLNSVGVALLDLVAYCSYIFVG